MQGKDVMHGRPVMQGRSGGNNWVAARWVGQAIRAIGTVALLVVGLRLLSGIVG